MKKPHKITNRIGEDLFIGDKVICRSNEPSPLFIGKIVDFENFGQEHTNYLPVVKGLYDSKVFIIAGVVRLCNDKIMKVLYNLKPIEQWNWLLVQQGNEKQQYTEKYGKKYRTFTKEDLEKPLL